MNITINPTLKAAALLLIGFMLQTSIAQAQSDAVEYEEAPSSISEDNDDRLRRQQEEEDRNRSHYYSAPSAGGAANEDGANPPDPQGDPGAPIDGGLSVLLAAGAAYGVKRMRKKKDDGQ
jgi:hypothetical protein